MATLVIADVLESAERLASCKVSGYEILLLDDVTTLNKLQGLESDLVGIRWHGAEGFVFWDETILVKLVIDFWKKLST